MDSQAQLQRTHHGHHQAEEPIRIHHPEEEEHHEKKGPAKVLKKAKEKAKKIKNALTQHGLGREQEELHGGAPGIINLARGRGHHHISDPVEEEFFPDPMKEEIVVPPGKKFVPVGSSSHCTNKPTGHESRVEGAEAPSDGYGNKVIISMVTPVYEKVKGTGAIVMKKLPFSRGGTSTEQGQDKGISAKEYLREKLSPGEEDKALSEVVAEKLHLGGDKNDSGPAQQRFQESGN